jgi:hypothetical protein
MAKNRPGYACCLSKMSKIKKSPVARSNERAHTFALKRSASVSFKVTNSKNGCNEKSVF